MNSVSRRKFLKITGATIGVAAAGAALMKSANVVAKKAATGVQKIPTYCDICFW